MWMRLSLEHWRSFTSASVSLAPFTVIVGRNSSGKSNLVDALAFVRDAGTDAETAVRVRGGFRAIRQWDAEHPHTVTVALRSAESEHALDDRYAEHEMVLEANEGEAWRFVRERLAYSEDLDLPFEATRAGTEMASRRSERWPPIPERTSAMLWALRYGYAQGRFDALAKIRSLKPSVAAMRRPLSGGEGIHLESDAANIAWVLHRMPEEERARVAAWMAAIVPGLTSIRAAELGPYLIVQFEQQFNTTSVVPFVAEDMSDGALRALAILVAARQLRAGETLIVEEPEANVHPGAAAVIVDALRQASERGMVVMTTHSPEILELVTDEHILVCDYRNGETHVGPLADSQRALVRDGLFTTAELMRSTELAIEGSAPRAAE